MMPVIQACIGLGANLGDAADTLREAVEALDHREGITVREVSRFYRTPAWGREDQPDFINAVALLETSLTPRALLERLLAVETEFGRHRPDGERWGPRTLDLDLLLYGDAVIDEPGLRVPHPHLHERAFALVPLLDVLPEARIPGYGAARDAVSVLEMSNIRPL
ncbi:MAG: 2-amino-4-hydroxy-6-hydroxymethyldihydropteridine diphosphokinase [Pseudoxanthomonas sp.]|uniref:2-amino-4-hydroxy-6-hydroxymethyldihydropteridine pyrophosphokinase n=2 Tax=Pseudoxanthomonas japonensis TaxID=69284 RepID=A0ABQ6ZKB1_9GAMM|nr:2-amino-4-hydroxy-6-hydroxymethyldihydropteridine diphosphokinase [Pseudoxanthomonas japonensis]KAF1726630.1 2-amino-4-hydroxy-6-hydroxymethyldihydropteridine diphosphokinase [Pseudoxanthomonas japonensis]MCR6626967.1 2-amino-4-hydroxy-6-hydroxymethyldihydropteridine diphosphokinase [Pseudoxanthomonas sp.]